MRIRRSRPTKDFVQVPNATARDGRLSHMARGILLDILSRPDGWDITADQMWRESVDRHGKASPGRRVFRGAFSELKAHGYIAASRDVLPGGKHGTILSVSDVPHAGTSARPVQTAKPAVRTEVPHAGTSESGTSARAGKTGLSAGHADMPDGGTSVPAGQTALFADRADVPHAGTSPRRRSNTSQKTDQIDDRVPAAARPLVDGLTAHGVIVRWPFKGNQWFPVLALVSSRGVPAMVDCARKIAAKYDVEKATYFMPAWGELPRLLDDTVERPPLRAVAGGYRPYQQPSESDYRNQGGF